MEAGVITPPRGEIAHPRAAEYGSAKPRSEQRTIGWLYGLTALALIALMGIGGLIMRFDQAKIIHVSPSLFYRIMTIHGAGMIVAAVLAMSGGIWFAMRETMPLSFNRMLINWVLTVTGALTALVSVLFGGFATGWTFLFPLPFHSAGQWNTWAAVGYLLGLALVAIGFFVLCIDMVLKTLAKYGGIKRAIGYEFLRGRDDDPPPPPAIAGLAVGIQGIVTTGMGVTIIFALLTRALDSDTYINALWAKNLTYHYGHTLANLAIYLAAGFLYMLLPRYAGRPWKTTKPIVIGWMATIVIVLTAYSHHLYMDFAQPVWAAGISMVASSAAAIPVAVVTIYTGMMLVWGSRYRWTLASTLLYLGFAGWAIGGVGAVIDSLVPVNFHFHNTLWVPAHFHTYMMLGIALWAMALVGYLLERAAGEPSSKFAGVAAPVLLMAGGYGLVGGWYLSGALGVPRRYAVQFGGVTTWSVVAAIAALTFATGVLIVFIEYLRLALIAKARGGFREALAGAGANGDGVVSGDGATAFGLAPTAGSGAAIAARTAFGPMISSYRQLTIIVAALTASLVTFLPAVANAVDEKAQWHHLQHGGQFLFGMLLAVAIVNTPNFSRLRCRSESFGFFGVILGPAVMLIMMAPSIYTSLEKHDLLHVIYHLGVVALGAVTAWTITAFDRFTAWLMFAVIASMGFLYAAGVGLV